MNKITRERQRRRWAGTHCAHCGRQLKREGFFIPHVGHLGPECKHKYGELALLIKLLESGKDITPARHANLARGLRAIGVEIDVTDEEDGGFSIAVTRIKSPKKLVESYEERRARFEAQLQIAELQHNGGLFTPLLSAQISASQR